MAPRSALGLYRAYVGGVGFFAWMPIFILYFQQQVTLGEALLLEAVYYGAVVLLEVPSGYFSDRLGRLPTMRIAAASLLASYLLFANAEGPLTLAVAQVFLAAGLAFNSGTDTSYHLALLQHLGLENEYGAREASLSSFGFAIGALAAIAGGLLGTIELSWAYLAAAAGSALALGATLALPRLSRPQDRAESFTANLRACGRSLRSSRPVRWLFAVGVAATLSNHIPYEFYQPYLEALAAPESASLWNGDQTPFVAALHVAAVQLLAVPAGHWSTALASKFGLKLHLVVSLLLQGLIIAAMGLHLSPWIALLATGRSIPRALQDAPLREALAPRIPESHRATFLSVLSLVGRLAFALCLVGLSVFGGDFQASLLASVALVLPMTALLFLLPDGRAQR